MKRGAWRKKALLLLTCSSTLVAFGGCLGLDLERLLQFGAAYAATEFVFDNSSLFDLFPDGNGAGN